MALGKMEVTVEERDLQLGPDRVIGHCYGTFPNGTEFRITNGLLRVKEIGATDFIEPKPDEIRQVAGAIQAKFGERFKADRVQINDAGQFVLLDTAPPTDLEVAAREGAKTIAAVAGRVLKATTDATKGTLEAVGITGLTVRKNGMVSLARASLENRESIEDISTQLTSIFRGLPDLEHLVQVAIREAQDDQRNKIEDYGTVSQFKLDAAIVTRLEAGEDPDDIRNALRPTLVAVSGRRINRSAGEVESILTIAFERAAALETVRANKKARADRVKGAVKGVVDYANEKVGNTARIVRVNGMVTRARLLLETGQTPRGIATAFETDFRGVANLAELTRVALKEAADNKANLAAAKVLVAQRALDKHVVDRLNVGETPARIRADLRPDYLEYTAPDGLVVERSTREVDEILDLAMSQGTAVYEGRKGLLDAVPPIRNRRLNALNARVRRNGMVSMARFEFAQPGATEASVRAALLAANPGTAGINDLIAAAIAEANDGPRNREAGAAEAKRLNLGAVVADRQDRGHTRADIQRDLEATLEFYSADGRNIRRSQAEIGDILRAAFNDAKQILDGPPSIAARLRTRLKTLVQPEKTKKEELQIFEANRSGMVVEASRLIHDQHINPADAERELVRSFNIDGGAELAVIAVREAQDRDKVYRTLYRLLEKNNEADRFLSDVTAGLSPAAIEARLRRDYAEFRTTEGRTYQRSQVDLNDLLRAAIEQADALKVNRAAEAVKSRDAAHLKNKLIALVPGTEQAAWDERLVDRGIIRYIRQQMEGPAYDEDLLREEVARRLSGEKDPEGMAIYAMARAGDSKFNRKSAEKYAFLNSNKKDPSNLTGPSLQEAIQTRIAAGEDDATIEAGILSLIKEPVPDTLSSAERRDIAKALVRRERSKKTWEQRGEKANTWARGPGWEALKKAPGLAWKGIKTTAKYGALGLGAAGLATVAGVVGAGALGLYGLKKVAPLALNVTKHLFVDGAQVVKAVGQTLLVNPIKATGRVISSPFVRGFQAARWGWNYPKPATQKPVKGILSPFTWARNKIASGWEGLKGGTLALAAGALFTVYGAGEGLANAASKDLLGLNQEIPELSIFHKPTPHAKPAAHGTAAPAAAAPAAHGGDHH